MKMIKRIACLILVILLLVAIANRISHKDPVKKDIEAIRTIAHMLEDRFEEYGVDEEVIDDVIEKIEEYNNKTNYVVTFDIINSSNPIISFMLSLPVDKEFFDSVEIGSIVAEDKVESLKDKFDNFEQIDQVLGDWIIIIKNKIVRE